MAKLTAADVEKRIRDYEAKAAKIARRIKEYLKNE